MVKYETEPIMRNAIALALAVPLGGCFAPTTLVERPPEGLQAIRFLETVRFQGPVGNTLEFPANTVMVQDRVRQSDGVPLWCGTMLVSAFAETQATCFTLNGRTVGLAAHVLSEGYLRELPEGSTERTRLR
jgi:hypothetical protein